MSITGLRGKNTITLLLAPLRLLMACWQASAVLLKRKPCVVLGMGGFASGPGGLMAWLLRKPLVIHEQNAIPGMTNKILASLATVVLQAFPSVFRKGITTGNPVRQAICDIKKPEERHLSIAGNRQSRLRLLVVGGSLGAVKLNQVIPQALARLDEELRPQVLHQTGQKNIDAAKMIYHDAGVEARVEAFIDDMASAYEWADLVICRAGAMTVFEVASAGVASILVPYPYAVDDHQTHNARYLETSGAAIIRQQDDLSESWLAEMIRNFSADRRQLLEMAVAARKLAIPGSAKKIANLCLDAGGCV